MNQKTKKQLLHKRKQIEKQQNHKVRKAELEEQYQKDHTNMIRMAKKSDHPENIYLAHKELAIKMRNETRTKPTSRLLLGEEYRNEVIQVLAWVSDIRVFHNKGVKSTRILLDRPQIARKNALAGTMTARSYDSHTWIDVKDIQSCSTNTLVVSIGDILLFNAQVHEYRGRIEHDQIGYKYGLHKITDALSGYPFFDIERKTGLGSLTNVRHDYPRHGEWILKWKSPTDYKTQAAPDYLDDISTYQGWTF